MLVEVTGVSEDINTPFWVKASSPLWDGEFPELIRPKPGGFLFMPAVGANVEAEEIPGNPGLYWWFGRAPDPADLPKAVKDAYPTAGLLCSQTGRFYIVFDDRKGANGALRLHAGEDVTIIVQAAKVEISVGGAAKATLERSGVVTIEGTEIKLGGASAILGVAREIDPIELSTPFQTWAEGQMVPWTGGKITGTITGASAVVKAAD